MRFVEGWKERVSDKLGMGYMESLSDECTYSYYDRDNELRFDPPVYKIRYEGVQRVILDDRWRHRIQKLADFGCAELGFFKFIKKLYNLHEVLMVDIDKQLLNRYKFFVDPELGDYLKKRIEPLEVKVFAGSICDPDPVLIGTDIVVAIELLVDSVCYQFFNYLLHHHNPYLIIILFH